MSGSRLKWMSTMLTNVSDTTDLMPQQMYFSEFNLDIQHCRKNSERSWVLLTILGTIPWCTRPPLTSGTTWRIRLVADRLFLLDAIFILCLLNFCIPTLKCSDNTEKEFWFSTCMIQQRGKLLHQPVKLSMGISWSPSLWALMWLKEFLTWKQAPGSFHGVQSVVRTCRTIRSERRWENVQIF